MLKLLFSSLVLTFFLGTFLDIKCMDPAGTEIEVIRKKALHSPKEAHPKEHLSSQVKTSSLLTGFVRAGGPSRTSMTPGKDELMMFEIPEDELGVSIPEASGANIETLPPAQEECDDVPTDSSLLSPVALLEEESHLCVKESKRHDREASLQPISGGQMFKEAPPLQETSQATSFVVSGALLAEKRSQAIPEETSSGTIITSSTMASALLPLVDSPVVSTTDLSGQKLLSVVLVPKQYKELELDPLIFRMHANLCIASDLNGSASSPISFYLLSLRESFLHPGAKNWNFTTGLKFRFQTLLYDSYSGVYPAKQPERGSLRNRVGPELENWQTQFLKECAPYKDARRILSEKEDRVKRKEAAVKNFVNPQTRLEAFQKAQKDLAKAKADLQEAEEVFTGIQEKLLFRYYRLFLHHHEKYVPAHLREQAMKSLAYLISVYPVKLTKPYEVSHKKPIKAFMLHPSEVDRHILMLTHRIEDMKREQGIFRDIKTYYELVFKPSVQNWDWHALKNWSQLKAADPQSNPLIKAQKALHERTKSPSFARYPKQTDDVSLVLSLMCKDTLGEKLEKNYFSKIRPFQEPVLTSELEARLFACSFPAIYRGQDEIISYADKVTMRTEGKDTSSRSFGGVVTRYYKITARRQLPVDSEPLESSSCRDDSFEKRKFIPIPFSAPKGVVMVGEAISFDSMNYPFEKLTFVAGDAVSLESMNFHRLLWPEVMEELEKRLKNRRESVDEIADHNENYKPSDEVDQISFYDLNQLRDYDVLFKEYLDLLKTQKQLLEELHKGYDAYSFVPYPFQLFQYSGSKLQAENASLLTSLTLRKKNIQDRDLLKKRWVEGKLCHILSSYKTVNLSENHLSNPAPFKPFRFLTSLDLSNNSLGGLRFVTPLLSQLIYLNLAYNSLSDLSGFVDISDEEKKELEAKKEVKSIEVYKEHTSKLEHLNSWFVEETKKQKEDFEAKKKVAEEKYEVKKGSFREELERKKKEINVAAEKDQLEEDFLKLVERRDREFKVQGDFYQKLLRKLVEDHKNALTLLSDQNKDVLVQLSEATKKIRLKLEEELSQMYKRIEEEGIAERENLMRSREAQVNTTLKTLNLSHNCIRNLSASRGDSLPGGSLPLLETSPLKVQARGIECLGRFQALTFLNLSGNSGIGTLAPLSSNTNLQELEASCCGLFGDLDATLPKTLKKLEALDVNGQMHLSYHFGQSNGVLALEEIKANDEKFTQRFPALKVFKAERRILRKEEGKPILLSDLSKQVAPSS